MITITIKIKGDGIGRVGILEPEVEAEDSTPAEFMLAVAVTTGIADVVRELKALDNKHGRD